MKINRHVPRVTWFNETHIISSKQLFVVAFLDTKHDERKESCCFNGYASFGSTFYDIANLKNFATISPERCSRDSNFLRI